MGWWCEPVAAWRGGERMEGWGGRGVLGVALGRRNHRRTHHRGNGGGGGDPGRLWGRHGRRQAPYTKRRN